MIESCAGAGDHFDMSGAACKKGYNLVRSSLYGEAWPSLSDLFWTEPGKLWFGLSGSVQIWLAAFWSGLPCKVWFCLVSSGLLLSAWI